MFDAKYITPVKAKEWLDQGIAVIIDVRERDEYDAEHIPGAQLIPLKTFSSVAVEDIRHDKKPIFHCASGKRALSAIERYIQEVPNDFPVYCLEGNLPGWKAAGFPTETSGKAISLERQVMMVAGSFILLGVLFSMFIAPPWIWLSAFVGAGLLFAGVSGSCMLKRLLMMLPYNKTGAA